MRTLLLMMDGGEDASKDIFSGYEAITDILENSQTRCWPDIVDPSEIDYVLIWGEFDLDWQALKNLKGIFSLGAGIDHIGDLSRLPETVPLVRLVDPHLTQEMSTYVVLNVLRFHRLDPIYREQQKNAEWRIHQTKHPRDIRVGIAGGGVLGMAAAEKLVPLGYTVSTWTRSEKDADLIKTYVGPHTFQSFLENTDILVCLLPRTRETEGIFDKDTLSCLPKGSYIINSGRGALINEADLLSLLNDGHIACAALDVFQTEPLPKDHAFWTHPNVLITPHVASMTYPHAANEIIAANILKMERNETPTGLVEKKRGY